jgi:hypothetical protein
MYEYFKERCTVKERCYIADLEWTKSLWEMFEGVVVEGFENWCISPVLGFRCLFVVFQ